MSNDSDKAGIGCVMLFLLIFVIPMVIELVKVLIPLVAMGGIGYGIYLLMQYDKKTGNVTEIFEKTFKVGSHNETNPNNTLELPQNQNGVFALPAAKQEEINELKDIVIQLKHEKEALSNQRKQDIKDALNQYGSHIDRRNKQELLNNFFGDEPEDYNQSIVFESRKHQEKIKKQKEELEIEGLKLNVGKQLFEQDRKIFEYRDEAKEDRLQIRMEMFEGFLDIDKKLVYLEKEITTFKGLVVEKFAAMEVQFFKELSAISQLIVQLRAEIKQEVSDLEVKMGKEVLQLEKQQMQIMGKVEHYGNMVKSFSLEVSKVKLDCERFALRGEDMLNRANTIYQRHRAEMSVLSKDINVSLQQVALHKGDFSNKVGQAKLMMDRISQDHYFALKDIAIEKVGVNMLRQDYQQRTEKQQLQMQNLVNEKRHLQEKINMQAAQGKEVAGLRHQLFMTEENLRHASNRNSIIQQEAAVMRRLSKG